jgi:endonuclease YncB( thermonuclease family)
MPYTLIKGTLHIHYPDNPRSGPEPDGDTLKFLPDNRQLVENLPRPNRPPRFTQAGITTIRFEGIDTLETHFQVEDEEFHQEMGLALDARDILLEQTGFGDVQFFDDKPFVVEAVEHHPIRGYLLSNGLGTFGRIVAFVYTGDHPDLDGSSIFVTPGMLDDSLNAFMLRQGQAYASFYLSLPAELREHLRGIVSQARAAGDGLWAAATATTTLSADIPGPDQLQELVIWPKLFRRLASFFQDGRTDLADLDAWLREDPRDRDDRLLLPNGELGNMHDLIVDDGSRVSLAHAPEDIVIVPDDFALPEAPVDTGRIVHTGPGFVQIVAALINPEEFPERGNETVTLLNTTNADIDLANWSIADRNGRQALDGVLAKGETVRVRLGANVQLSNVRDTITVLGPDDEIVDQVAYEARNLPGEGFTMVF